MHQSPTNVQDPQAPTNDLRISRAKLRQILVQHLPPQLLTFNKTCASCRIASDTDGSKPVEVCFQVCAASFCGSSHCSGSTKGQCVAALYTYALAICKDIVRSLPGSIRPSGCCFASIAHQAGANVHDSA